MVDDKTLATMTDAEYPQAVLYKLYITIHFLKKQKFSIFFLLLNIHLQGFFFLSLLWPKEFTPK